MDRIRAVRSLLFLVLAASLACLAVGVRPSPSGVGTEHPAPNTERRTPKAQPVPAAPGAGPAAAYRYVVAAGVSMHVVQIDPTGPGVRLAVATAGNGIGCPDSWTGMIERTQPVAAINSTYFCPQSAVPVGTIVVRGRTVHQGWVGTALALRSGQSPRLFACSPGIDHDWGGFETVLRAGPRLIVDGRFEVWPRAEGFRDPAVTACKRRTAVGVTRHGKLLLVAVNQPVQLGKLAMALHALGARDAMCLDGGSSTGLFYRGKTCVKPRRPMTNLLVVYDSAAAYDRYAGVLNPVGASMAQGQATSL